MKFSQQDSRAMQTSGVQTIDPRVGVLTSQQRSRSKLHKSVDVSNLIGNDKQSWKNTKMKRTLNGSDKLAICDLVLGKDPRLQSDDYLKK